MQKNGSFIFLLALIVLAMCSVALADQRVQEQTAAVRDFPVNVYGRETLDLSGSWRYIVDPMREGLVEPPKNIRYFAKDAKARGNQLIEYDWDSSPEIQVPGDWNTQVPELFWYEGLLWYRTTFDFTPKNNRRYMIYFEGANYWKRAYLNNTMLGEHEGGFTPFAFDISEALKRGKNSLVVAVDNTRRKHQIPSLKFDWFNYGGITRPVHIVELPQTYIHNYRIWLEKEGRLNVLVMLRGKKAARQKITVTIPELGIRETLRSDMLGHAEISLNSENLTRWSPENPKLYRVTLSTRQDKIDERMGFRTIEVVGRDILLNGKSVNMKGISVHEEAIGADGGRRLDWDDARALLQHVKGLGGNYVRLAHYPHTEKMVRLADEMGLMVWSEIPLWQSLDFNDPRTLKLAEQMMSENTYRDFNRASIVIWSVANETPQIPERMVFLRRLIDTTRALDGTRLISSALDKNKKVGNTIIIEDPLGAYLDVFSVNTYEGWYGPRVPAEVREVYWQSRYEKPMLISEFGAGALYDFRSPERLRWSQEYQADIYTETLKLADRTDMLRGISPWILKDFRSPRRYHGEFQGYWNRKGVIDEQGRKKLVYDILKEWFAKTPNYREQ